MSGREEGRGWIAVLAAMVVLTAGALVAYLLAPYDPSPNERADTGTPGTVDADHRVIAVQADGALVILDERTGERSEIVTPRTEGTVTVLQTTADLHAAYVVRDDASIELIRLRTGDSTPFDTGRAATIGPIAFPQLDRTVPRPRAEQIAFVSSLEGREAITVENLTTGSEHTIEPAPDGRVRGIVDLALSPFENQLFGVSDDGLALFRLDADLVDSLEQADAVDAPAAVERYVDITPYRDAVAAIVERSDGSTDLVEIDPGTLRPTAVLHETGPEGPRLRMIDADAKATSLLIVTENDRLLAFTPSKDEAPRPLADGVARAVW